MLSDLADPAVGEGLFMSVVLRDVVVDYQSGSDDVGASEEENGGREGPWLHHG